MAKEILILAQNEDNRGINFSYGLLIPSTPRIVQGELIAYTPSSSLSAFFDRLEEEELAQLDAGELIWWTGNLYLAGPLDVQKLEAAMQIRYRGEAPKRLKMFEEMGASVGMRFSADPGRGQE